MTNTAMAKGEKKKLVNDDDVTSVKARVKVAKLIRKYAALLEVNQEEILDRYTQRIEDDLYAEMAKQQAQKNRPSGPKS